MDKYSSSAGGDVETGLGPETVVLVGRKSSSGWMGKLLLAMLLVVLCAGGALLLLCYWDGRQQKQDVTGGTAALIQANRTGDYAGPHYTVSQLSSKAKAAIHLEGSVQDDEQRQKQLEWRSDQGQAFSQGGFQLSRNAILIPASGLFFVYSQASFQVSCGDGDREAAGQGLTPLSHRVWRHSDSTGGRTTLLSAVRSACQLQPEGGASEAHGWYNTIYLGAVFQLRAGDRLWTETNRLSELETDEGKNFFGVFAL